MKTIFTILMALLLIAALPVAAFTPMGTGKKFDSPEAAGEALATAAKAKDHAALQEIFGPASAQLHMTDQVQANAELEDFAAAYDAAHRIAHTSDADATLVIGPSDWPFPVPLLKQDGQWAFHTTAGVEEISNRRIGRNELAALETARVYVDAQREYASRDRDGDEVLEYAQHLLSAPGLKDGLYWSPELDGEMSPLGPLVAAAQGEGYRKSTGEKSGPKPFNGYCFKLLTRQGKNAPGGAYKYITNGNIIGGFALVAWPADYGTSGIMTIIINQQGKVYQKDLGPKTATTAKKMTTYDPGAGWSLSAD